MKRHFIGCILLAVIFSNSPASTVTDNFDTAHNYVAEGTAGTIWDGLIYNGEDGVSGDCSVAAVTVTDGGLSMISTNGNWERTDADGLLIYKNITGDFSAQVQVVSANDPQYHDMGLMVRVPGAPEGEDYIMLRHFAYGGYTRGRSTDNGGSSSFGSGGSLWPYLRLVRIGDVFEIYIKEHETDDWMLLGTQTRADMPETVQVGICQATFSDNEGSAVFDNFSLSFESTVSNPLPLNGAGSIPAEGVELQWRAPASPEDDILEYRVYLGRSLQAVTDAGPGSSELLSIVPATMTSVFSGPVAIDSYYFWRVDYVVDDHPTSPSVVEGRIWTFQTYQDVEKASPMLLDPNLIETFVNEFNAEDRWFFQVATDEEVSQVNNGVYGGQFIKNADFDQNGHSDAFDYLKENIPLFDAPDADFVRTYYYRWWTYRKHIKNIGSTEAPNLVVTEFIDPVGHADSTNTVACPVSHHIYEGRWIHDVQLMNDYERYWMVHSAANPRRYTCWLADAVYARHKVRPDAGLVAELLTNTSNRLNLETNYYGWVSNTVPGGERQVAYLDAHDGLFWQHDDRDGMENSYAGSGKRATLNSCMVGDTRAIAEMFRILAGYDKDNAGAYLVKARQFDTTADGIKQAMLTHLWDPADEFFKVGYGDFPADSSLQDKREEHGFTPWYFNIPDDGGEVDYDLAWSHLDSFTTPYGLASGAHDEDGYNPGAIGRCCQWDGPVWPYATSITLKGMANLLRGYEQNYVDLTDFYEQIEIYTNSHRETITRDGETRIHTYIDESSASGGADSGHWTQRGAPDTPRGYAYNHSTYCDIIISDLVGFRPRADAMVEVDPLLPTDQWDWFCLDNVLYHGRILTIVWDRDGSKYGLGSGLKVYVDGALLVSSPTLKRVQEVLPGETVCLEYPPSDINRDCIVNLEDLAMLCESWQNCNLIPDCN